MKVTVTEFLDKYTDLLWYCRSVARSDKDWKNTPKEIQDKAYNNQIKLEQLYPEEIQYLVSTESSDYYEGFYSGIVAGMRFVLTANECGLETAYEEFPDLDT